MLQFVCSLVPRTMFHIARSSNSKFCAILMSFIHGTMLCLMLEAKSIHGWTLSLRHHMVARHEFTLCSVNVRKVALDLFSVHDSWRRNFQIANKFSSSKLASLWKFALKLRINWSSNIWLKNCGKIMPDSYAILRKCVHQKIACFCHTKLNRTAKAVLVEPDRIHEFFLLGGRKFLRSFFLSILVES